MPDRHVTNEPTPFAMVPEALLFDPDLSDKAVRLYGVLRRHGDDPSNCYPSKRRLAELMGCAPASVGRPLRELEDSGWITRVARTTTSGDPDTNGYLVRATRTSGAGSAQVSSDPPRSGAVGVGAQERAERESLNESQPNEKETPELTLAVPPSVEPFDPFAAFWKVYPRRVGKPEAARAWNAMVAKPGVPIPDVMTGLDRWLAYWKASRTAVEYMPHPSTWLRQQRWNDEPVHSRPAEQPTTGPRAPVTSQREGTSGRVVDL